MTGKRIGRPPVPDRQVIDGARRALVANPAASMAEIARAAGVGMSALYARFVSREVLLQYFADEGNVHYAAALDRVEQRLAQEWASERVLREFMAEIVRSDIHAVWLGIAGTFVRTAEDTRQSAALVRRGERLVARCHADGVLRPGVTWRDLFKAQVMLAAIAGTTPRRTNELRLRMLEVVLTGFAHGPTLPGRPPGPRDVAENRPPRSLTAH